MLSNTLEVLFMVLDVELRQSRDVYVTEFAHADSRTLLLDFHQFGSLSCVQKSIGSTTLAVSMLFCQDALLSIEDLRVFLLDSI